MTGWGTVDRRQREWWDQAQTEVQARLARVGRGESWAPAAVLRCLRVFVAEENRQ